MENIYTTSPLSKEDLQEKRDFLDKKEKELREALEKGKQREEELKQRLGEIQEQIQQIITSPNISKKKKLRIPKMMAMLGLISILLMGKNIGETKKQTKDKESIKKEVVLSEKTEISIPKDTVVIKEIPVHEEQIVPEKKKTPEFTVTIKKDPQIYHQQLKNNDIERTYEEVFSLIDKTDPKIDQDKYTHRNALSAEEKNIVKTLYTQLVATNNENEIKAIINKINDIKILRGTRDICVKSIYILKNKKKDISYLQGISQQTVRREYQIINQKILEAQNIIQQYVIEPKTFSLVPMAGRENASDLDDKKGTLQVHYILNNHEEEIGKVSFDNIGNVLTKEIRKKEKIYEISQRGTNIYITEKSINSNQ